MASISDPEIIIGCKSLIVHLHHSNTDASTECMDPSGPDFEFRMSMLPDWAQNKAEDNPQQDVTKGDSHADTEIPPIESEQDQRDRAVAPVEGRWAEVRLCP